MENKVDMELSRFKHLLRIDQSKQFAIIFLCNVKRIFYPLDQLDLQFE